MSTGVLHLVSSLQHHAPGAWLTSLASEFAAGDQEHRIVAIASGGPLQQEIEKSHAELQCIDRRWTADPIALGQLILKVRQAAPQVVHAWDDLAAHYAALAAARTPKAKLVMERTQIRLNEPSWKLPLSVWLRKQPDAFVTPLESIRQAYHQLDERPSKENNLWRVISPGIETIEPTTPSREKLASEFKFPTDAKLIGIASPLSPAFGVKELIWAADMVRVLHPSMRLLIVGDGPQRGHLERFARTAAEPENIRFLGNRDDWRAIAAGVDVFWHGVEPSAHFTPAMLHAMAAGVPVVASDIPSHRELVTSGKTGHLAKLADRAVWTRTTDKLLSEPDFANTIGVAAKRHVEQRFSLAACASSYAELYAELASGKSRA